MDDGCFFFFNPNVYNSDATAAQVDRRPLYMGGGGVPIKAEQMCWSTLPSVRTGLGFRSVGTPVRCVPFSTSAVLSTLHAPLYWETRRVQHRRRRRGRDAKGQKQHL